MVIYVYYIVLNLIEVCFTFFKKKLHIANTYKEGPLLMGFFFVLMRKIMQA